MTWSAWIGALAIGLVLGLLGSGGSILAVPVFVYLAGEPAKLAIAESLGVVALISAVGAIPFMLRGKVDGRSVVFFGGAGMAGTYGGAYLSTFMSGTVQLVLFAGVMLLAAVTMFREPPNDPADSSPHAWWKIVLEGGTVGVLTGLVGVGGGFLIVPALVLLGGLPMHVAVGTSLAVIALKSVSGFYKYIDVLGKAGLTMDWSLILIFAAIGIVGSFVGGKAGQYVPQATLKKAFAVFLVAMGLFVFWQNAIGLL